MRLDTSAGARKRRRTGLGDKSRLLAIIGSLIVAGFLGSNLFAYLAAREAIRGSIERDSLPIAAESIYAGIQRDLVAPVLISSVMASDSFLHDWVAAGESDLAAVGRYLGGLKERYHALSAFFVSERSRRYYYPEGVLKTVSEGEPRDAWYFRVRGMGEPYELNVDPDLASGDTLTVFINYRVLDAKGLYLGAAGIGLPVSRIGELVDRFRDGHGTAVYFVDARGQVVAGRPSGESRLSRLSEDPALDAVARGAMAAKGGSCHYDGREGRILLNVSYIPELSWFLFVEMPESPQIAGARRALRLNIGLAGLVLALVLLAATLTVDRYQSRLERTASTDPLTGAMNRLSFGNLGRHALALAVRSGRKLTAAIFDIDDFKLVNDRHGHAAGDGILRLVVEASAGALRDSDLLCRWGGEEFLVLLPECPAGDALPVAEKLRAAIAAASAERGPVRVTVSVGLAEAREGEDLEALVARADAALLRAKAAGKDRVVAS